MRLDCYIWLMKRESTTTTNIQHNNLTVLRMVEENTTHTVHKKQLQMIINMTKQLTNHYN